MRKAKRINISVSEAQTQMVQNYLSSHKMPLSKLIREALNEYVSTRSMRMKPTTEDEGEGIAGEASGSESNINVLESIVEAEKRGLQSAYEDLLVQLVRLILKEGLSVEFKHIINKEIAYAKSKNRERG